MKNAAGAACDCTGVVPVHGDLPTSAGGCQVDGIDPRDDVRGGLCLSDQGDVATVLAGPTSCEPGSGSMDRQLTLLVDPSVSSVPYGELKELAKAQVRRECRRWGFDWDSFVADGPEWGITEVVHRRAVQQERARGLDLRPTDIPTDTVLMAVRDVITEWTVEPALRPSYEDFCLEQARRGDKGREAQVLTLVASGVSNNADIGRRLGVDRSCGDVSSSVRRVVSRLLAMILFMCLLSVTANDDDYELSLTGSGVGELKGDPTPLPSPSSVEVGVGGR